jgi:hypothetical protein
MKKLLITILFLTLIGAFLHPVTFAASCDSVTWNPPIQKSATVVTLSGNIANCANQKVVLRIDAQLVGSSPIVQGTATNVQYNTDGSFTTDTSIILQDGDWRLFLRNNGITINNNDKQPFKTFTITPSTFQASTGSGTTVNPAPNGTAPAGSAVACDTPFTANYDPTQPGFTSPCPKACSTLLPLQQKDKWECSTQDLRNLPLETADVKLTIRPKTDQKDTYIVNQAYATYIGSSSSASTTTTPTGGKNIPPNNNTCSGHYDFSKWPNKNPLAEKGAGNFGDPECTLDEPAKLDQFYALIRQLDPTHEKAWDAIAACETGHTYSPNSFYSASPAGGAYGLFQMGGAGQLGTPKTQNSSEFDRGDVPWQQQISNAISYNKTVIGESFHYWECAHDAGVWQ